MRTVTAAAAAKKKKKKTNFFFFFILTGIIYSSNHSSWKFRPSTDCSINYYTDNNMWYNLLTISIEESVLQNELNFCNFTL